MLKVQIGININSTLIAAYAVGGNSSVRVSASAVVDGLAYDGYKGNPDGYNENQSVAVSAGPTQCKPC